MSHNIQSPVSSFSPDDSTIFTVRDDVSKTLSGGTEIDLRFFPTGLPAAGERAERPYVTVGGNLDRYGIIAGEDLYALRELLNELPEEAFVRPAEPVDPAKVWTEGDVIKCVSSDDDLKTVSIYSRGPDDWTRIGLFSGKIHQGQTDDAYMTHKVAVASRLYRVMRQASTGVGV